MLEGRASRIIFSVDYPFGENERRRSFLKAMPVSRADREKVAYGNTQRLLRL